VNLAGSGLGAAVAAALLASLAAAVLPERFRPGAAGAGTALAGAAGLAAGIAAVSGQTFTLDLPGLLPLSGLEFAAGPLSGFFIAVTGGVAVAAGIYAIGYTPHSGAGRLTSAVLPLFVASMLGVPAAASAGTLLACWELMALTSLLLVLTEHRRRTEVAEAGRWYAVMTHLGLVCILISLMILASRSGGDGFAAARLAARHMSPALKGTVFVLALAGFGSKAGIVPLHAWLPRAHPEAPSHVSALMSAAMVNLGVYGIARTGFVLLGGGSRWWWLLVLALGAASAVYGILQAAMSTDLKRLLGYSTTENMGLVLTGLGAAGLFASSGHRLLAALALTAALLHLAGHAAFKTLLFLAAGSVLHGTGTRDLDALGGLRPRMPVTTAAFGWGALAASALPPGTAFVSEWLLVQALIHGLPGTGTATAVVLPAAVAAVALTAGLAVATFVKAFGTGFLARPRSGGAARAAESPAAMLAGMGLAGAACAALALVPGAVLPGIARAAAAAVASPGAPVAGLVTLRLAGIAGSVSPLLLTIALLAVVVAAAAGLRALPARRARRTVRLWDCGAGPLTARMEYTATSFAEPLQRVFDDVVAPETGIDVTHLDEARYLVAEVAYRRRVPDRIERRLYRPVLDAIGAWGTAGRRLAPGSVHRYLGYGFWAVTALLVVLAVTR
jgi:formate hydrogenlyase subunit 3/multisubunit Na+/H+ antiporter MnhD subunit